MLFLFCRVRLRDDKKTFAICISYQRDTRHYLIDKNQENKFGIQDGPKFECIMMVGEFLTDMNYSRLRGRRLEPHRRHCVVSLSKNINLSLVLVQPRKTCPFITERFLMGRKESNKQTNKQKQI